MTKAGTTTTTRYLRDATGNVMAIYQEQELIEQPIYGSTRMGLYRGGRLPGQRQLGHKQYELSNHLGNVYVTMGDEKIFTSVSGSSDCGGPGQPPCQEEGPPTDPGGDPDSFDPDVTDNNGASVTVTAAIKSYSHYYPFGLDMPGLSFQSDSYRYGFNGQEIDTETDTYAYEYRMHDPKTGRFWSVDPLTSKFPWNSPYAFAENKVIDGVELEGLEVVLINEKKNPSIYKGAISNTDKSAVHIYAHGTPSSIDVTGDGKWSYKPNDFTSILQKK